MSAQENMQAVCCQLLALGFRSRRLMIVSENSLTDEAVVVAVVDSFGVAGTLFLQHTTKEKATFSIVSERHADSRISDPESRNIWSFIKTMFSECRPEKNMVLVFS